MKQQQMKIEVLTMLEQGKLKGGFSIILAGKDSLSLTSNTKCLPPYANTTCGKINLKCERF